MGYRRMDMHVLKAILRRWIDGQSISNIHREEGFDRKTIRSYNALFEGHGLKRGIRVGEEELDRVLPKILPENRRQRGCRCRSPHCCIADSRGIVFDLPA